MSAPPHRPAAAAWEEILAADPESYPDSQRACLAELVSCTGPDFVGELLEDLCRDGSERIADLANALGRGDAEGVERSAHTLKSMSRTLGFESLGSGCMHIERIARAGSLEGVAAHAAGLAREMAAVERLRDLWAGTLPPAGA